jgi:membrane fusion protein (multidrug efflux system)
VPFLAAFVSAKGRVAQAEARVVQAKQNLARVKPLLVEDATSNDLVEKFACVSARAGPALQLVSDHLEQFIHQIRFPKDAICTKEAR